MSFVIFIAARHALLHGCGVGAWGVGHATFCSRAGLAVYVYVWATRLYDFCLIAAADAANKQAPLVTHTQ